MLTELAASLINAFVLDPFEAEVGQALAAARAPAAVVDGVKACLDAAPGVLAARTGESWTWALGEAAQVALGLKSAETAVAQAVPACAPALAAARPYLGGEG
jgi:uncharacterized protein (DUF697 family)